MCVYCLTPIPLVHVQIDLWIFCIACFHVLTSLFTIFQSRWRLSQWRRWQQESIEAAHAISLKADSQSFGDPAALNGEEGDAEAPQQPATQGQRPSPFSQLLKGGPPSSQAAEKGQGSKARGKLSVEGSPSALKAHVAAMKRNWLFRWVSPGL
jgi:hypothetical protein